MPCHRCAARQVDPVRGPSHWTRLVVGGEQVLVCPDCQRRPGWDADADRCPSCGSAALVKALGVLRCRTCGAAGTTQRSQPAVTPQQADLSAEVTAALDRIFGRDPAPGA